jgi:thiol-disulfide isomerase/thioredoxin
VPYLVAAVVIVGILCLLDLVLTYGVIRRLREHTEQLAQRPATPFPDIIIGAGSTVGAFTATTEDGESISADDLQVDTLVGFFSPWCGACEEKLPSFLDAAAAHPGGRDHALAVVIGPAEDAKEQVAALSPKARVIVAPHGHDIEKAFEITGFPCFALLGEDLVVKASGALEAVAAKAAA